MAFAFKKLHTDRLAFIFRYAKIPEMHKHVLLKDLIISLLEDNPAFNYRRFYRLAMGCEYKGENLYE
jgi:hypothetical protein